MEEFVSMTRRPEVQFKTLDVAPPGALYIGPDDGIQINTYGAVAGLSLYLTARILLPSGVIVPSRWVIPVSSDRSYGAVLIKASEGYLMSIAVWSAGTTPAPGQCYAMVLLRTGGFPGGIPIAVLTEGYISGLNLLSWPHGRSTPVGERPSALRVITGTDPAAGAEISETVPTNALYHILGVEATLVTDATVANRYPQLIVDDGTTVAFTMPAVAAQAASLTQTHSWASAAGVETSSSGVLWRPLPGLVLLPAGWRIRTSTVNLAGGDNWGAPRLYVEDCIYT